MRNVSSFSCRADIVLARLESSRSPFCRIRAYCMRTQDQTLTRFRHPRSARSKYRFMEKSFAQKKNSLEEKIPEFRSTLDVLALLQAKKVSLGLGMAEVEAMTRSRLVLC